MATPAGRQRSAKGSAGTTIAAPGELKLSESQGKRLSALTDITPDRLVGRRVADLAKEHPFIDPALLLFRKVCGRVVRTDPVTGAIWGVPGATVHVWDTDVNLFASFPTGWPYGWFWPWGWRREEIATAKTDLCGNFCVWIPRFDIDWVLQWRLRRRCYIESFRKPSIRDLVERLPEQLEVPPHIGPWPDPDPLAFLRAGVGSTQVLDSAVGPATGRRLAAAANAAFGAETGTADILDLPAFPESMPHPDAPAIREVLSAELGDMTKRVRASIGDALADERTIDASWIGPFLRCYDVFVPEFQRILDVPDITFSATQDVDGDGDEETIYSEGLFDVRWDAGPIPAVTLHASASALASPSCGDGPDIACAAPELVTVGHMPLKNATASGVYPIVDTATGYAVRPNRPHPSGRVGEAVTTAEAATAPMTGLLEFYGCAHNAADGTTATAWRIMHRVSTDGGATFGAWQPILETWTDFRSTTANPLETHVFTTTDGWYRPAPGGGWMLGDHYLLQWHGAPNGRIELQLDLGVDAGAVVNVIGSAPVVRIVVDNNTPHAQIVGLEWREAGGSWQNLTMNCPTIHRNHHDIEIRATVHAWASHLQSFRVSSSGCGSSGGAPALIEGLEDLESGLLPGIVVADYWHKNASDNNVFDDVTFAISHLSAPGAYAVGVTSWSRAFNPGDGHVYDPSQPDLSYSPNPNWWPDSIGIAIVD
jgi:hypothetical protein